MTIYSTAWHNLPKMGNVNSSIRPSNANIMNVFEDSRQSPVIVRKSQLLGTSSSFKKSFYGDNANFDELNTPNPQKVEIANLDPETDTFCVRGSVNIVPQCMGFANYQGFAKRSFDLAEMTEKVMRMIKDNGGMKILARRYATQLVNGSILFRNRFADNLRAVIDLQDGTGRKPEFDCDAENCGNEEGIGIIADYIEKALTDTENLFFFHPCYEIYGRINYGGEVYPSQELEMGNKEKILFKNEIMGISNAAGLHSPKVGNALRTIDTWYSRYSKIGRAIPVDPFGPDKSRAEALRKPRSGETFYEILAGLDQLAEKLEKEGESDGDALFFAAMMVRGGVFSSDKEKSEAA